MTFDGYRLAQNPLADEYSRFKVAQRLLFTGHSHQAWPDVARSAQLAAYDMAAELIDEKWEPAFAAANQLRQAISGYMGGVDPDQIALGQNTFELVFRWLTCFKFDGLHIVTTDSEFHTVRRLRQALQPQGVRFTVVPSEPLATFEERFINALTPDVSGAIVSHTFFNSGYQNPTLANVAEHCDGHNISLLVDLYHTLGNSAFDATQQGLTNAFLVGGGYKYLQWGEGNCFMAVPKHTQLKPAFTGWYGEFDKLAEAPTDQIYYSDTGSFRFAGATYDITANLRANNVASFFDEQGLDPISLAQSYQYQLDYLQRGVVESDLNPAKAKLIDIAVAQRKAFMVLICDDAGAIHGKLGEQGILTDYRGNRLRIGPAPYLNTEQLDAVVDALRGIAR